MTWNDLRELRRKGMRPSLPVVVSVDDFPPTGLFAEEGCMVIQHKPGEVLPVELLEGLMVWLFLRSCGRAQAVMRAMGNRGVKADCQAWCECMKRMDAMPVRCEVAQSWQ